MLPLYDRLRQILAAGTIGELKQITCQYGFVASGARKDRKFDSSLGGGALLDIGIYDLGSLRILTGQDPEVIRCPVDINGFEYELREASRCVKLGRTGSDRYTPQDSLALTRLMYDTRMSWGMKFAGEV